MVLINGDDVEQDIDSYSSDPEYIQTALMRSAVWMPYSLYERWPVALPWAIRDLRSRPTGHPQKRDEWGTPDEFGFFRDDNSMVKGLSKGLGIESSAGSPYVSRTLGRGFVAAHIWRLADDTATYTTRDPNLYSFLPNVVWLPRELAKRSDKEGSLVQRALQSLSYAIYRRVPVRPPHKSLVEDSWKRLAIPGDLPLPVKVEELNWFVERSHLTKRLQRNTDNVYKALGTILIREDVRQKVVSSRYTLGLPLVPLANLQALAERLAPFSEARS